MTSRHDDAPVRSKLRRWMRLQSDRHATPVDLCRAAQAAFHFPAEWLDDHFHWIHDEAFAVMHQMSVMEAGSLWARIQDQVCGAITAAGVGFSDEQRDRELIACLQCKGYSVIRVAATYLDHAGDAVASYFVCRQRAEDDDGQLEADLHQLGFHFDRNPVLIIPRGGIGAALLGAGSAAKQVIDAHTHPAACRFLERLRSRELPHETVPPPGTRHGKWAQRLLVKELERRWQSMEGAE